MNQHRRVNDVPNVLILPTQWVRSDKLDQSPEMRLAFAVFEDAVRAITHRSSLLHPRAHEEFVQARAWILDDDREWPFAFANLCDMFGLDVNAVRESLPLQWQRSSSRRTG